MSRVGKEKIILKDLNKYYQDKEYFVVEGKLGVNKVLIPDFLQLEINEELKILQVKLKNLDSDIKHHIAMNGTIVRLIKNAITGVTVSFTKTFLFKGVGYKYSLDGQNLTMHLGYSHPVYSKIPDSIKPKMEKQDKLTLTCIDNVALGLYVHKLKNFRKWNIYKGKGIIEEGITLPLKEIVKSKK